MIPVVEFAAPPDDKVNPHVLSKDEIAFSQGYQNFPEFCDPLLTGIDPIDFSEMSHSAGMSLLGTLFFNPLGSVKNKI